MPVPSRWLQYSKFGQPIPGTPFLPLKCPLRKTICDNLPEEHRFTPEMVVEELPALAMIIDLTNTSKYYQPQELRGLRHVKVMCPGQQVPGAAVQSSFFEAVDSFLQQEDLQERLIGVHCTHGVNRTGFLICKYMVSKLGFSPEEAAKAFNKSRGHQMEREAYVKALKVPLELLTIVLGEEPVDLHLERQYVQAHRPPASESNRWPPRPPPPPQPRRSDKRRDDRRPYRDGDDRRPYRERGDQFKPRRDAPQDRRRGSRMTGSDRRYQQRDREDDYRRYNPMNDLYNADWRSQDGPSSSRYSRPYRGQQDERR